MTAPVRPPLDQIVAEADRPPLDAIVAQANGDHDPMAKWHAAYKSGRLQQNVADLNEADQADVPSRREIFGGTLANLVAGVPGGEAITAGAHALAKGEPYATSLNDVRRAEQTSPPALRIAENMAGGIPAAMAMPGSPAMAGARLGVGEGLLNADPNASLSDRLQSAATRGTIGAILGKAAQTVGSVARGQAAPTVDEAVNALSDARTKAATPAYQAFLDLGDLGRTPKLDKLIGVADKDGNVSGGLPIIRRAIDAVKSEDPTLMDLPDTHAAVLDQAYKIVGDKAWRASQGFTKGNARDALATAIDEAAQTKGGSYENALSAFREPSQQIAATQMGAQVLKNAARGSTPPTQMLQSSPAAFERRLPNMAPDNQEAVINGIAAQLGQSPLFKRAGLFGMKIPLPYPSARLSAANDLFAQGDQIMGRGAPAALAKAAVGGMGGATAPSVAPIQQQAAQAKAQIDAMPLPPQEKAARKAEVDRRVQAMGAPQ